MAALWRFGQDAGADLWITHDRCPLAKGQVGNGHIAGPGDEGMGGTLQAKH